MLLLYETKNSVGDKGQIQVWRLGQVAGKLSIIEHHELFCEMAVIWWFCFYYCFLLRSSYRVNFRKSSYKNYLSITEHNNQHGVLRVFCLHHTFITFSKDSVWRFGGTIAIAHKPQKSLLQPSINYSIKGPEGKTAGVCFQNFPKQFSLLLFVASLRPYSNLDERAAPTRACFNVYGPTQAYRICHWRQDQTTVSVAGSITKRQN